MGKRIFLFSIALCCFWVEVVFAAKLAVFPVEDLSLGRNGVNFPLTGILEKEITGLGMNVTSRDDVISFMVRNRIRWLGSLNTANILKLGEELGVELVMMGTVCQYQEFPAPAVGITLSLIRTGDAKTIWSGSVGSSSLDEQQVLALTQAQSAEVLLARVAKEALEKVPESIDLKISEPPGFLIETVRIGRRHVKPDEKMQVDLRLRPLWLSGELPQVYLQVGETCTEPMILQSDEEDLYFAEWAAPKQSGSYPMIVIQHWPFGWVKRTYLGEYRVDDTAPEVSMEVKGVRLNGTITFRDEVIIVPQLLDREPLHKWQISVETRSAEVLASTERDGGLPPKFTWKGVRDNNQRVEEGDYLITLRVWDRAENMALAFEPVSIVRSEPDLALSFRETADLLFLDLDYHGEIPVFSWEVEVRSEHGELLHLAEGEDLPVSIEIAKERMNELTDKEKIGCVVLLKDALGNKSTREIDDLLFSARQDVLEEDIEKDDSAEWAIEF